MKQSVSLSQILNGNSVKKKTVKKIISKSQTTASASIASTSSITTVPTSIEPDTKTNKAQDIISIDLIEGENIVLDENKSIFPSIKSQSIIPEGKNVSNQSIKCFLMQKKNTLETKEKKSPRSKKKKALTNTPTVISLTDDDLENEEIIDMGKSQFENITNPKRLTALADAKKTKLKDLFKNFKRPVNTAAGEEIDELEENRSFKRLHPISKLDNIPTPLPFPGIVSAENKDEYNQLLIDIHQPIKVLQKKKHILNEKINFKFGQNEYKSLATRDQRLLETETVEYLVTNGNLNGNSLLWSQLFEPNELSEIILDPQLKKSVNNWIIDAFNKLKKTTSRKRLVKKYRELEKAELGNFIIYDDVLMEPIDELAEEFVPLMILHGNGIGKNTLINIIMKSLNGQILEINSSQNRSKRDLSDQLLEYCTSHYVKDKGSNDIVVFDDVDVLFGEHDKQFWLMVENLLIKSRKPVVLICRDINFIPRSLIEICQYQESIFEAKKVSSKTVVTFLKTYCEEMNLDIDTQTLTSIVQSNNRDIRKCLSELQFWFSSNNKLSFPVTNRMKDIRNNNIFDYSQILDLASQNEFFEARTKYKSSILQFKDPTLMYGDSFDKLCNMSDDQDKNKNDYMVDYRIHIWDSKNLLRLPFEKNLSNEILDIIKEIEPSISNEPQAKNFFKSIHAKSVSFLESRVSNNQHLHGRKTRRTTRRIEQIMENFNSTDDLRDRESNENGKKFQIEMDFMTTRKKSLTSEILPYIYEMAYNDLNIRLTNKEIYEATTENMTEDDYKDALHKLTLNGIIKKFSFGQDPQELVNLWQS